MIDSFDRVAPFHRGRGEVSQSVNKSLAGTTDVGVQGGGAAVDGYGAAPNYPATSPFIEGPDDRRDARSSGSNVETFQKERTYKVAPHRKSE